MSRSTIEFNDAADQELSQLTKKLGVKTKAEIVRNALSLYAYLVDLLQKKPNRALGIIAEDEGNRIEKVIVVPGISLVQTRTEQDLKAEAETAAAAVGRSHSVAG